MDFLPKDIKDIIMGYKEELEFLEHKEKFKESLNIIDNLVIVNYNLKAIFIIVNKDYNELKCVITDDIIGEYITTQLTPQLKILKIKCNIKYKERENTIMIDNKDNKFLWF